MSAEIEFSRTHLSAHSEREPEMMRQSKPVVQIELNYQYGEEAAALAALDALVEEVRTKIGDRGIVTAADRTDNHGGPDVFSDPHLGHKIGDRVLWDDGHDETQHGKIVDIVKLHPQGVAVAIMEDQTKIAVDLLHQWPAVGSKVLHQRSLGYGWAVDQTQESLVIEHIEIDCEPAFQVAASGGMLSIKPERLVLE